MSRRFLLTARTFGILVCRSAAAHGAPWLADGPGDCRQWVETWGSAQMVPGQQETLPAAQRHDATLPRIVHVSIGGTQLRVRVSNVFGTQPLVLDAASVALCAGPGRADVDTVSSRVNLTQAFNSLGTTLAPGFGGLLILSATVPGADGAARLSASERLVYQAHEATIQGPYLLLAGALVTLALLFAIVRLPVIRDAEGGLAAVSRPAAFLPGAGGLLWLRAVLREEICSPVQRRQGRLEN